ncbi:hypothetical protein LCI18_012675 [Fusarium solani-melongenae]|uniref:Uncharacterized protein n=1 Tax=Fusarium solani subsp. cucurbitae TaxID=2747967 RepID=A0ACD3ZKW7_FUSSC|nr:hypothetical protein LCI18_012675 [Fusarium solani-melongenae]
MYEEHPYRGVAQGRQISPDNTPWRRRICRQEQDDRNHKASAVARKDKIKYRIEPLKERNSWAGCRVDGRNVHVWGDGWSMTESAKRLIQEAKNCRIDGGSPKFNYGGGDGNREWAAEMNGGSDVDDRCISEAIEKAGGSKVTCEKTAAPLLTQAFRAQYGTREGRLTGNCWAKADGIGCDVFMESSGCEWIGDSIWQKIWSSCKK